MLSVSRFLALIHHKVRLHLAKCVLTGRKLKWGGELGCQKPRQATYTQRLKVMGMESVSSRFPYFRAKNSASGSETFEENTFDASNIVIRFSELKLCCDRWPAPPILMSDHMKERASCDVNTKIYKGCFRNFFENYIFFRYRKYGWPRISTIAIRILFDTIHCWRWQWWITNTFPFQCFYERSSVETWKSNPIPVSQL